MTNSNEFDLFIEAEKNAIEVSKWLEGEKLNTDPGEDFVKIWVKKYAKKFKENWDDSNCKNCKNECRRHVIKNCNNFMPFNI